jgi:uncharacterized protein (DUF1800 family)
MDRRKFLIGSGAAVAAAAGLSETRNIFAAGGSATAGSLLSSGDSNPEPIITQSNDLTPYSGAWTDTTLRHLLRRAMFGVPLAQFQAAQALGSMTNVVNKLLTVPAAPAKPASYVDVMAPADPADLADPKYGKTIANQDAASLEQSRSNQVANWWMNLILQENLSITERMTLMWSNHFVIGSDVVKPAGYLYTYNQMLRANALGNMKTFVRAVSIDPSMLIYLNGNQNFDGIVPGGTRNAGTNINENYARELQELFTLGLNDPVSGMPNYTQNDVEQAAVALTGWAPTTTAPFTGVFYPNSHNNGQKTFLGQTGNWGLDDIINIIFTYKGPGGNTNPGFNSAYWFCQRIYTEFVYYVPNTSVITAMANLMLQSNWEVIPVLRALLQSDHFYDVQVQNAQLKSPVNFIASLIREFGLTYTTFDPTDPSWNGTSRTSNNVKIYTDPNITLSFLTVAPSYGASQLGQQLLQPPNVKGWPGGHNWISTGTFQEREVDSTLYLPNPVYWDGSTKRGGITIEFTSPTAWANATPNSSSMTIHDISIALTTMLLNKTLGPNESNTLYLALNPSSLPDNDFYLNDKNVSDFAIVLANLPEFQLV